MIFSAISIFPEMFTTLTDHGITGRACKNNICTVTTHNPRDFVTDPYKRIDNKSYGGGPGMVMQVAPLERALQDAIQAQTSYCNEEAVTVTCPNTASSHPLPSALPPSCIPPLKIYMSPQGEPVTQGLINHLSTLRGIIIVCGRYEGVD